MDNIEKYYDISLNNEEKEELYTNYKIIKKEIEDEFCLKTKLNKKDLGFLFFAIALQFARQYFLTGTLGESFDKNERCSHDDREIKNDITQKQKKYKESHKDWNDNKSEKGYRSWQEIITGPVPYDATSGSKEFELGLGGPTHRRLTLGHDPILGWIFGTLNIITDTITLTNFTSYEVDLKKFKIEKPILTVQILKNGFESITEDKYRLPAALFAQGVHLESDKFTKTGLPIPILSTFSQDLAGELYSNQYDYLCFLRDIKTIKDQVVFSMLINIIITLVHGLYNTGKTKQERKLYEVKTRKILLYSNVITSTSNLLQTYISKDIRKLDLGGLMVTLYRIVSDITFMKKIKREFVNTNLSEYYQKEIEKLDADIEKTLKELHYK